MADGASRLCPAAAACRRALRGDLHPLAPDADALVPKPGVHPRRTVGPLGPVMDAFAVLCQPGVVERAQSSDLRPKGEKPSCSTSRER